MEGGGTLADDVVSFSSNENEKKERSRSRSPQERRRKKRSIQFPSFSKPLYTKKDFDNYQTGQFDRHELNEAYDDYVQQYRKEQEYEFYADHKYDHWFTEKYDPSEIHIWRNHKAT